MNIESLIKALDIEYKKSKFLKNIEKNRKRNKNKNKKKQQRYIEIRRTQHDSITVKCESFCRKPVYIVITNFSQYDSLYSAFRDYIENKTWGHGQRLLQKLSEKSDKIEKELDENSFVKVKLR